GRSASIRRCSPARPRSSRATTPSGCSTIHASTSRSRPAAARPGSIISASRWRTATSSPRSMRGSARPAARSWSRGRRPAAMPSRRNPGSTIHPASRGKPSTRPAKARTTATEPASGSRGWRAKRKPWRRLPAARPHPPRRRPRNRPAAGQHQASRRRLDPHDLRRGTIEFSAAKRYSARITVEESMSHAVTDTTPWYRSLDARQWNTLLASNLGWLFDGYETYALIISIGVALRQLLDPSQYTQIPAYAGTVIALTLLG